MAINTRQNSMLVAENWKKVYQTFQEADFTSYDFETLRKTMIDYLKVYYPEDFNDFTESSEFIALIDLIAFMGQSLAFRTDLNARENFIDTAERRDSILKLARLISYNPKRNIAASGFLKFDSVTTTETLYDSNGLNLSNLLVSWNDQTNDNWLEQFTTILNATFVSSQMVGKPGNTNLINGVTTEEYTLNLIQNVLGVYKFQAPVEGNLYDFEAVSATSVGKDYIYETAPNMSGAFNILYRNDNYGNASNDTGFFLYFKQGALASQDFTLSESLPNRAVPVAYNNINQTDVWLYSLNTNNTLKNRWSQVPAVTGVNVIYNESNERNLYQVNSKAGDQIDLVFGDGSFANIPVGSFRIYYRVSNGLSYKITPDEVKNVIIPLPYVSREGRQETLTIRASLQYTVSNATARESAEEIKQKAPQQYYTQNRMITGEDYNILPYTSFGNVLKAKSINRTSSGLSRFLDVIDSTGKYSSTNFFGTDGVLYRENFVRTFGFTFNSTADIVKVINRDVVEKISSREMLHFYYANYPTQTIAGHSWALSALGSNEATGYFVTNNVPAQIGNIISNNAKYLRIGSIVKFRAKAGYHFDGSGNMVPTTGALSLTDKNYLYASITNVYGDGTNNGNGNFDNGTGPVTINVKIPTGAVVDTIYPVFKNAFTGYFVDRITDNIKNLRNFGLTYKAERQVWDIVAEENLNTTGNFSLDNQGSTSGTAADSSWVVYFSYTADGYVVYYRGIEYVFHSVKETTFFYDKGVKIYDTKSGTVINDHVKVLKTNSDPDSSAPLGSDATWFIYKSYIESDGYVNKNKIYVTYADANNDGIPDNPDLFNTVVNPAVNTSSKYVFFQTVPGYSGFDNTALVDNSTVVTAYATLAEIDGAQRLYLAGQLFYATSENNFYLLDTSRALILQTGYIAKLGRQELAFQYRHNSPDSRRIDPSSTNVIDIYVLTTSYEKAYRSWIQDPTGTVAEPVPPTSLELSTEYASLNDLKSISDTIVFNNARFKLLFGSKAPTELQATFKVIKNSAVSVSDNDVKTSVINAVNTYFEISNWDFGETFYFSELSAYLHRVLSPNVASIMIVPTNASSSFGSMYQINAEPHEIIISAATVDNVEIIPAITAAQLNLTTSTLNKTILV